jgi:WD40 repeat protein
VPGPAAAGACCWAQSPRLQPLPSCFVCALQGHPEEVYACIFLQQQQQQQQQQGGGEATAHCGASPERLVTASGESLFLWDLATQRLLQQAAPPPAPGDAAAVPERWRPGYLFGVAAQPEGPLLGAACSDGRLRLWARQGGDASLAPLATLPWNAAMGADCCWAPGGLFCAVAKDGAAIVLDVRRGACLHHLQLDAPLLSCTLLQHGGSQSLVAAGADGAVHFVDLASGGLPLLACQPRSVAGV